MHVVTCALAMYGHNAKGQTRPHVRACQKVVSIGLRARARLGDMVRWIGQFDDDPRVRAANVRLLIAHVGHNVVVVGRH